MCITVISLHLKYSNSIGIATTVGQIVKHFEPNTSAVDHNADRIYLALTLVALLFVKALIFVHFDMGIAHQGMQMRVAICDLIYNKVPILPLCILICIRVGIGIYTKSQLKRLNKNIFLRLCGSNRIPWIRPRLVK